MAKKLLDTPAFADLRKEIGSFIQGLGDRIFSPRELRQIVADTRSTWEVPEKVTVDRIIDHAVQHELLSRVTFAFPSRKDTRYLCGNVSRYAIVQSLRPNSFFSHYTAMYLHELTEQIPKTYYLNVEQSPPPFRQRTITQAALDMAFHRSPRVSKSIANYGDERVCLLNSMGVGQVGIIDMTAPDGTEIRVTNLERTLVDIVVRPTYSGGVHEVLNAYRAAAPNVSANKLIATLRKLDFVYPYHQAVGFYLERAGRYKDLQLALFQDLPQECDFYLTHGMKDTEYSPRWRLFYPKGM